MTVKDLAGKLIASGKFTEKDRAGLEAMSEEGLTALTALAGAEAPASPSTPSTPSTPSQPTTPSTPPPAPPQPTKTAAEDKPTLTEDEQIAALPESLRKMVDGFRALQSKRKENLITALSKSQTAFTVEQLKGKDVDELETYAKLLGLTDPAVDYSLVAAARSNEPSDDYPSPPDVYGLNAKQTTQ